MSSSIAATREAWSRLQTCEVTSDGNTLRTVAPTSGFARFARLTFPHVSSGRARKLPLADDWPAVNRAAPGGGEPHRNGVARALDRACGREVHRLDRGEVRAHAVNASVCVTHGARAEIRRRKNASEPDHGHRHRSHCRCEAQADPPAEPTDLDRPLEVLRRSRPQHLGEAADRSGELPAGRAIREMRAQKDALEPRQFPVEVGSRPLAGAITGSVNRSHTRSDGGSHLKVSHSEE